MNTTILNIKEWDPLVSMFHEFFVGLGTVVCSTAHVTFHSFAPELVTQISVHKDGSVVAMMHELQQVSDAQKLVFDFEQNCIRIIGRKNDITYQLPRVLLEERMCS